MSTFAIEIFGESGSKTLRCELQSIVEISRREGSCGSRKVEEAVYTLAARLLHGRGIVLAHAEDGESPEATVAYVNDFLESTGGSLSGGVGTGTVRWAAEQVGTACALLTQDWADKLENDLVDIAARERVPTPEWRQLKGLHEMTEAWPSDVEKIKAGLTRAL